MKTKIKDNGDHFALIKYNHGTPSVVGSTTWVKGLIGPVYIKGGRERALEAIKQKEGLGYMPDFCQ